MSFILSVVPEKRFLLFLMPFLVLFSVIPIHRVTEYGLSTFSLSRNQKNTFLVIVIIIVIILSGLFTLRYEKLDPVLENEKMDFAQYALENNYLYKDNIYPLLHFFWRISGCRILGSNFKIFTCSCSYNRWIYMALSYFCC